MAGRVVGSLTFVSHLDDGPLVAESRVAGERAAAAGSKSLDGLGEEWGKKFDNAVSKLGKRMVVSGRKNGLIFSKSFTDRVSKGIGNLRGIGDKVGLSIGAGISKARRGIDDVRLRAMYLGDGIRSLGGSKYVSPFLRAFSKVGSIIGGIFSRGGKDVDSFGGKLSKVGGSSFWNKIPQNGRQVIFWVSAIASASGEIAVLGSALGGALAVGATSFLALAAAGSVLYAGLQGVMGDLADLPAAARGGASAIQGLVKGFQAMQGPIQAALLVGLGGPINAVTKNLLPTLKTGFVGIATTLNGVLGQLAAAFSSPAAVSGFQTLLAGFQPIIASLGTSLIAFGSALGTIFIAALPSAQRFAGFLADIGKQFQAFIGSTAGATALDAFFMHTNMIFSALGPLIAATGKLLAGLVTPSTVAATTMFLGVLTQFMPILGQLLGAISQLSLLNIIAQVLLAVGQAIQPILPQISTLANLLGSGITTAIQILAPMVATLIAALAPFLDIINVLVATLLPPIMTLLQSLGTIITGLLVAALNAVLPLFTMLVPPINAIIAALMPIISAILPPLASLLSALIPLLSPIIGLFTALLGPILALITPLLKLIGPILNPLIDLLSTLMTAIIPVLTSVIKALTPVFTGVANAIGAVLIPVVKTIQGVLEGLINFITGVFTGNWSQAWKGLVQVFSSIVGGIGDIFRGIVNGAVDIINGLISGINTLTSAVGIPKIPLIPHWASGALLTGPTVGQIGRASCRERV